MFLTSLELGGFKSFADRTVFSFDPGITALVGPNGCGKSNVVDAVRWVLGEMSAKSLRGTELLDVIFNGSATRAPLGFAEVTLVFHNPSQTLPVDYEEVAVCRRLFRSGESQYMINGSLCRLKDIRELFYGTGLGGDAYSIIEQGKVDLLLQANPKERRGFLEEAAGISKYRSKRKETASRLERVRQDLARLEDVLREIESSMRSLKIQAHRAQKYHDLQNSLRQKKIHLGVLSLHGLRQSLEAQEERIGVLEKQIAGCAERIRSWEEKLAVLERLEEELSGKAERLRGDEESLDAEVRLRQQRRASLGELLETAENEIREISSQIEGVSGRLEENRQRHEKLKAEREELERKTAALQQQISEGKARKQGCDEALESIRGEMDRENRTILDLEHRRTSVANEIRERQEDVALARGRLEKISAKLASLEEKHRELVAQRAGLEERLRSVEASLGEARQSLRAAEGRSGEIEQARKSASAEAETVRTERARCQSELELLRRMEQNAEGVSDAARQVQKAFAREDGSGAFPILADCLELVPDLVQAAEALLGPWAGHLVVPDWKTAAEVLTRCRTERIPVPPMLVGELGCADQQAGFARGAATDQPADLEGDLLRALCLASSQDEVLRRLVRGTRLDPDVLGILEKAEAGVLSERTVTADGTLVDPGGSVTPLQGSLASQILTRRALLRQREAAETALGEKDRALEERLAELDNQRASSEAELRELRARIYDGSVELGSLRKGLEGTLGQLDMVVTETGLEKTDQADLEEQISRRESQIRSLEELSQQGESLRREAERRRAETADSQEKCLAESKSCSAQLSGMELSLRDTELRERETASRLEGLAETLRQDIEFLRDLRDKQRQAAERREKIVGEQKTIEAELPALQERIEACRAQLSGCEAECADARNAARDEQEALTEDRKRAEELEQQLRPAEIEREKIKIQTETLIRQFREEQGIDLEKMYGKAHSPVGPSGESLGAAESVGEAGSPACEAPAEPEGFSLDASEEALIAEIRQLQEQLARLGNVNLTAFDDLKDHSSRAGFLRGQIMDLRKSESSLEGLMKDLDVECRKRFEETLEKVRENFNTLFRKLFGGGRAEIFVEVEPQAPPRAAEDQLPAEDSPSEGAAEGAPEQAPKRFDPLEAGIEIIAKPPGKEPVTLSQLSGGERALTTLALVLGIFLLRPSPVCILDEVDAPLDENNVERFLALIKEFSRNTQFVIITHTKKTMAAAGVLYGITMEEAGVSKKLSLRLVEEAVALEPELASQKGY